MNNPFESESYSLFVIEMAKFCDCDPPHPCPCDGVLAGGLCDGFVNEPDFTKDDLEWEEDEE